MKPNGIYTCKLVTYNKNELPAEYHNSDIYDKICYAKIVKLKLVFDNDNIVVKSVFSNENQDNYSEFVGQTYTKDTLTRAYFRSVGNVNYYVLVCSPYKLENSLLVNSTIPLLIDVTDLRGLCNTVYKGDHGTIFCFDGTTESYTINKIVLRSILKHLNYNILLEHENVRDSNQHSFLYNMIVETDMPYEIYNEILGLANVESNEHNKNVESILKKKSNYTSDNSFCNSQENKFEESSEISSFEQTNMLEEYSQIKESLNVEQQIEQSPVEFTLSEQQNILNDSDTQESENSANCELSEEEILKYLEAHNLI